jgi:hypothetical protein
MVKSIRVTAKIENSKSCELRVEIDLNHNAEGMAE